MVVWYVYIFILYSKIYKENFNNYLTIVYELQEEALEAFVKYETLEGNNQYFCEKCDKKSDAHKGLKFTKFPYILTLQLKRFDFDQNAFHRIKLNDK